MDEQMIEQIARAIWRDLHGKRGEEHAFEFHTIGEREAMSAARAAHSVIAGKVAERVCTICTAKVSSYPEGMCCHCQEMPWPVAALAPYPERRSE